MQNRTVITISEDGDDGDRKGSLDKLLEALKETKKNNKRKTPEEKKKKKPVNRKWKKSNKRKKTTEREIEYENDRSKHEKEIEEYQELIYTEIKFQSISHTSRNNNNNNNNNNSLSSSSSSYSTKHDEDISELEQKDIDRAISESKRSLVPLPPNPSTSALADCPICLNPIYKRSLVVLRCTHLLHPQCHVQLTEHHDELGTPIKCPTCRTAV